MSSSVLVGRDGSSRKMIVGNENEPWAYNIGGVVQRLCRLPGGLETSGASKAVASPPRKRDACRTRSFFESLLLSSRHCPHSRQKIRKALTSTLLCSDARFYTSPLKTYPAVAASEPASQASSRRTGPVVVQSPRRVCSSKIQN